MSCPDACVKENPTYARTICVFCRAIICTKSLGKHTSLVDAEKLEIQKIKAHCEHCKEYQRALRSSKIERGLPFPWVLDSFLYYFVKPEFINTVKKEFLR